MNKNPIYDEDYVTLGYLKNYVASDVGGEEELEYSKNYGSQPKPPYHVNDTWTSSDGIYVCISERLIGEFDMSDWKIIVDTEKYDNYIDTTLEVTVDMLRRQIDGKIESFVQEDDPSIAWDTSIIKEEHVYDYWRPNSTSSVKEKIYQKFATNPVSYGWVDVIAPIDVWDTTDGHKNLWNIKPTIYEARDLWYIGADVSEQDMPDGCVAGTWAVSANANTEYNKEDWVNSSFYIDLNVVEKHFYTKDEVDTTTETLRDEISTSVSASETSILAKVESTYETKETVESVINDVSDMNTRLGNVNEAISSQNDMITSLELNVGVIQGTIQNINTNVGYIQTTDQVYIKDKPYYKYENDVYVKLVSGIDYVVGGNILPAIVYENKYERDIKAVTSRLSSTEAKLDIVSTNIDGTTGDVRKITTSTGFTLDENGLHIEKSDESTKSNLNEAGLKITDSNSSTEELLFYSGYVDDDAVEAEESLDDYAGKSVVFTKDLVVKEYITLPNGRFENVHSEKHGKGIGLFM